MTADEQRLFFALLRSVVEQNRPDVVITYGGSFLDWDCFRWLKQQGIPAAFYLANPDYHLKDTFQDIPYVFTPSEANARLYKERLELDPVPVGSFVDPVAVAPESPRDCVTLINCNPEKGVSLFLALAAEAARRGRKFHFLAVQSRLALAAVVGRMGLKLDSFPNVEAIELQRDISLVFARTRMLLMPSLWHEAAGRVILEAQSCDIPVLATDSGGSEKQLNGGGFLFPLPPELRQDYLARPSAETVSTWLSVIETLFDDAQAYDKAVGRARRAWSKYQSVTATKFARLESDLLALAGKDS